MCGRFLWVMVVVLMAAPVWADRHERRVSPTVGGLRVEAHNFLPKPYRDCQADDDQLAACASLRNYVQSCMAPPGWGPLGEPFVPLNLALIGTCLQGWGVLLPNQYVAQKWSGGLPKRPASVGAGVARISAYQSQARNGILPQPASMSCPETEFEIFSLEQQALKGNMLAVTQLYLMHRKGTYTPGVQVLSVFKQKGLQRKDCRDF